MKHSTSVLTDREMEILHLIASEHSSQEIAKVLSISSHTVISHRKNLKSKLHARNTAGIIYKAIEKGVLKVNNNSASF